MATNINKSFAPNSKDIRYLNRDFTQLKASLINFSKAYYPNTYTDFSPTSPGIMFIEHAAYVGDVLSYYTDYAFTEGIMNSATERKNIINLASNIGYKIQASKASTGNINLMQICPSATDGFGNYYPDTNYMLIVNENSQFSNTAGSYYILNSSVDFSVSSSFSPRTDSVYSRNSDGTPQFFLLTKPGIISAGQLITKEVVIGNPSAYFQIALDETNVIDIINVVDSDNNIWHETDYLAQELVPISVPNDAEYEGSLSQYKDSVPYILQFLKTSRRFITSVDENNITTIEFGAGINGFGDQLVTFDSALIGAGLRNASAVNIPLDPSNFLQNENYGIVPQNTTLIISYLIGGGLSSNCQSNDVTVVVSAQFNNSSEGLTLEQSELLNTVKTSLAVTNTSPCLGGTDAPTNEEIKLNAVANFAAQNRTVTQNDFLTRIYSLPSQFGSIAKAQIITNTSLNVGVNKIMVGVIDANNVGQLIGTGNDSYFRKITYNSSNPFAINVYVLSYDANKNLTPTNEALITNLITYLKNTRMMTDAINIIDGYIINIGIDFSITVYKSYNKKNVLLNCITAVQNFFNIDSWGFSQPINLSQLNLEIAKVDGVLAVVNVNVFNKTTIDGNYSSIQYNISDATKNGVVYPSIDPSCWEVKFPNSDITGTIN